MKAAKVPVLLEGTNEYVIIVDDGEEWDAVTEAFHRHFPDRAELPIDYKNYTQAEIDAVMVEFEPKKKPGATTSSAQSA